MRNVINISLIFGGWALSVYSYGKIQYEKGWKKSAENALKINREAIVDYDAQMLEYYQSSQE